MSTKEPAPLTIAACIVARDEAALLPACLASVASVVDHAVVVDHGSRDESASVARAHGAEVLDAGHLGYEDARNRSLDAIPAGAWVLVLDADERLAHTGPETRARLRRFLAPHHAPSDLHAPAAFALPRYEYTGRGRFSVVEVLRLFRAHPRVRYPRSAWHASVVPALEELSTRLLPAPFALHHVDLLVSRELPARASAKRARARARAAVERARPNYPALLDAYLGLEHAALGDYEAALALFALSSRRDPDCTPSAQLFSAQVLLETKRYSEAARAARAAIAYAGPHASRALHNAHVVLAEVALSEGSYERALRHGLEARAHRRWYASAHLNLAALALHTGAPRAVVHAHGARAARCNPWVRTPECFAPEGDRPNLYAFQRSLLSIVPDLAELAPPR